MTGRPTDAVLNSHWHNDHIWGNQVFRANTEIISTGETRRLFIATRGHGAYDSFMADAEANLAATRAQFQATFFPPQEGIAFMSDLLFIGHHP